VQRPDTPDGLFHPGDPLTGQKGTPVTAAFLNSLLDIGIITDLNGSGKRCQIQARFTGVNPADGKDMWELEVNTV